jgi:hypothetical protein
MRCRPVLFFFLLLSGLIIASLSPAVGGTKGIALGRGDEAFRNGPLVKTSGKTFTYRIDVTERAYRLRLGLDKPEIGDVFTGRVFSPSGAQVGTFGPGVDLYSAEWIEMFPARGTWRLEIEATDVSDSAFRIRAKLEGRAPRPGRSRRIVPPNLQVLPPHEASFLTPISNGSAGGEPIALDTQGAESCHPEEHLEDQALRCLRFAFGVKNTGRGPMDLYYTGPMTPERPLFQTVSRADGSIFARPAGTAVFHKTHGHYHHGEAIGLRLFEVTDRNRGTLRPAGEKRTKGFAHRNELLREWTEFYPTVQLRGFGLLPGWADIYEWDRPGNYIDFGLNGDGHYLVRMWADPVDGILESNERDNVGYTYMRVTGSQVKLLEAGRGKSPWDPCKIEVGFGGHPDPRKTARPASCPPDTV